MQEIKRGIIVSSILVTFAISGLIFSPVNLAATGSGASATAAIDPFYRKPYSDSEIKTAQNHDSLRKVVHRHLQTTGSTGGPVEMQFTTAKHSLGDALAANQSPADQGHLALQTGDRYNSVDSSQSEPSHADRIAMITPEDQNLTKPENRVHAQSGNSKISNRVANSRASFTVTFLLFSSIWLFFYNLSNIVNYKKLV